MAYQTVLLSMTLSNLKETLMAFETFITVTPSLI